MRETVYIFYLFIRRITGFVYLINSRRITSALARGALTASIREIDPNRPTSWEFSAFSQNGEDGIIDYLSRHIKQPNHYFVEIGAYDGIECNTAYLAIARKWCGLMIEGDHRVSHIAKRTMGTYNLGCVCVNQFVSEETLPAIKQLTLSTTPDVFSLDIDGIDYYIAKEILSSGWRPKLFVVEYNSVYGPDKKQTIPYNKTFDYNQASPTKLYYGCSIALWKQLFKQHGYQFLTVESRGVNAFFIDPKAFRSSLTKIRGLEFQENFNHRRKYHMPWPEQYKKIKDLAFMEIK